MSSLDVSITAISIANEYRQRFFSLTLKNDAKLLGDILTLWYQEIQPIIDIKDFLPALAFQPLTKPIIKNFAKDGGNALGITEADGPLTSKSALA